MSNGGARSFSGRRGSRRSPKTLPNSYCPHRLLRCAIKVFDDESHSAGGHTLFPLRGISCMPRARAAAGSDELTWEIRA